MFAGRYMWWLLTSTAIFLIVLLGFDALAWVGVNGSNCASYEGSCYRLSNWLLTDIKPKLVAASGVIVIAVVLVRILYLRFNPLWAFGYFIWSLSVAAALNDYVPLWHGDTDVNALIFSLPPVTWATVAMAVFLCFPLEDEDMPDSGTAAPMGLITAIPGLLMTLQVFSISDSLPVVINNITGAHSLALMIQSLQGRIASLMMADSGNSISALVLAVLFALALALRIVQHEKLTGNFS